VTIRILADQEPYASFADTAPANGGSSPQGPLPGPFEIFNGPAGLDEAPPDIVVLPAADFLALPRDAAVQGGYIAYGRVSLMDRAFEWGCFDYIREPWSLPELYARLRRLQIPKFRVGNSKLSLVGSEVKGRTASVGLPPGELALFRLLVRNAPFLVTKEAALVALSIGTHDENHALGRCAVSLRHSLDSVEPGLGRMLHAVRGRGYRFDAELCG
jgi:DNA-binding winged helix-turn-helix (wHTH) protein